MNVRRLCVFNFGFALRRSYAKLRCIGYVSSC